MELDNERLNKEIQEDRLNQSRRQREFLDKLQNPSTFESFYRAPKAQKMAVWAGMGLSGQPPLSPEELAETDIANIQGDLKLEEVRGKNRLAEQALTNQGYAMRPTAPTADDIRPDDLQKFIMTQRLSNPKFKQAMDNAKAAGRLDEFMQDAANQYRQLYKTSR